MPSVFKRAVNAVKDQTTISLVSFSRNYVPGSSCDLDVAILKATSHEEQMADEKHITKVILMVVSSTICAAACVHALARRIARTHDWVVALKSLQLVHHLLRDGGTYFSHEAASLRPVYSGGRRLLDLSNFSASQSSYSNAWDYTAFVRTYARYLDARLESALFGKLRNLNQQSRKATDLVSSMKPAVLLDHIKHWRRLLDRVISMKPTGPTRNNRLIQITLFMVTRESFEFYRDITSGLTLLLDKFFQLDQKCRANTVETCELAAKQFEELDSLYDLCIKIGVGKMIEYPHVQMISHNLVTTLRSYLHNNFVSAESSPASETRSQPRFSLQALPSDMSEEVLSDYYSVASEPTSAQKKKAYEQSQSSSMAFDAQKEKSKQSDSEGWEILLVETASKLSDPENNNYGRQLMLENAKKPFPENYKNPFLQDYINQDSNIERSIAVKPGDLSLDFFDPRKLSTERNIQDTPKGLFFHYSFDKRSSSTEISIAEKPTQRSFNKNNFSTEGNSGKRTNFYSETEKKSTAPVQTVTAPPTRQTLIQRHLRWMEEQQKVYRSIGC
jgi:ANTH domain